MKYGELEATADGGPWLEIWAKEGIGNRRVVIASDYRGRCPGDQHRTQNPFAMDADSRVQSGLSQGAARSSRSGDRQASTVDGRRRRNHVEAHGGPGCASGRPTKGCRVRL